MISLDEYNDIVTIFVETCYNRSETARLSSAIILLIEDDNNGTKSFMYILKVHIVSTWIVNN